MGGNYVGHRNGHVTRDQLTRIDQWLDGIESSANPPSLRSPSNAQGHTGSSQVSGVSFLQLEMSARSTDHRHDPPLRNAAEQDDPIEVLLYFHRCYFIFIGHGRPSRDQVTAIDQWIDGLQSHARPSVLRSRLRVNPPLPRARCREAGLSPPQGNVQEVLPNQSADPISPSAPLPREDIQDESVQRRDGSSFLQLSRAGECGCCATRESIFGFQLVGNPEADDLSELSKPCDHRGGHNNVEDAENVSPYEKRCAYCSLHASNDALKVFERSHWDLFLIVVITITIAISKSSNISAKFMAIPMVLLVWAFGLWAGKMTKALQASLKKLMVTEDHNQSDDSWKKWMVTEDHNQSEANSDSDDEARFMKKSTTRRNLQQFLDDAQTKDVVESPADDFVVVDSDSSDETAAENICIWSVYLYLDSILDSCIADFHASRICMELAIGNWQS